MSDGQWLYVLAMQSAELETENGDQKRVAQRRLNDPLPGDTTKREYKRAPPRKKKRAPGRKKGR